VNAHTLRRSKEAQELTFIGRFISGIIEKIKKVSKLDSFWHGEGPCQDL
jgi:hypothetical protein